MATPTTRRQSVRKPTPVARSRHVTARPAPPRARVAQPAGNRGKAVIVAATAGMAVTLLEVSTGSLNTFWPLIPASTLLLLVGSAVMPLMRAGQAEQHAERQRLDDLERAARHQSLADIDAMSASKFEQFIAGLCHRDGFKVHQHGGGSGDLGADVVAEAPDGRRIVIQCKRYKPGSPVPGPDIQRFLGTVRAIHNADVPVFVTTAWRFTKQSRELGASQEVVLIDRDLLSHWNNGMSLERFLPAVRDGQSSR